METSLIGKALDFGSNEYGFDPRVSNLYYNSYAYVVNHLNLAISRKKLRIKIKYTRRTLDLVKVLFSVGYISHYSVITPSKLSAHCSPNSQNSWIFVTLLFFRNTPFFKSLRLVSSPSKKHTTTLKGLQLINVSIKSSLLILSTPYGIVDHREALRLRTGGVILCIVS